jgi:hypothetical protein
VLGALLNMQLATKYEQAIDHPTCFALVPQNAIDIALCQRITGVATTLAY